MGKRQDKCTKWIHIGWSPVGVLISAESWWCHQQVVISGNSTFPISVSACMMPTCVIITFIMWEPWDKRRKSSITENSHLGGITLVVIFGNYTCPPPIQCLPELLCQWFLTFVILMFLNCNSQKPQPAQLVVKASGSCSPKLLSNPRLRTSVLCDERDYAGIKGAMIHKGEVFDFQILTYCWYHQPCADLFTPIGYQLFAESGTDTYSWNLKWFFPL